MPDVDRTLAQALQKLWRRCRHTALTLVGSTTTAQV